jgi:hypothetical protein
MSRDYQFESAWNICRPHSLAILASSPPPVECVMSFLAFPVVVRMPVSEDVRSGASIPHLASVFIQRGPLADATGGLSPAHRLRVGPVPEEAAECTGRRSQRHSGQGDGCGGGIG